MCLRQQHYSLGGMRALQWALQGLSLSCHFDGPQGLGGEGGQIRVSMNYSPGPKRPTPSSSQQRSGMPSAIPTCTSGFRRHPVLYRYTFPPPFHTFCGVSSYPGGRHTHTHTHTHTLQPAPISYLYLADTHVPLTNVVSKWQTCQLAFHSLCSAAHSQTAYAVLLAVQCGEAASSFVGKGMGPSAAPISMQMIVLNFNPSSSGHDCHA